MWCVVWGDGQFNTSHADILYLFLNNTITRHCMNFCYPNYPTSAFLLLLSPGFNHIFPIIPISLVLPTLILLPASLPPVFLKALYLVPPSSLSSSMIFLQSFLQTLQFCSLMIPPSTLSVTVFPPSSHHFSSVWTLLICGSKEMV